MRDLVIVLGTLLSERRLALGIRELTFDLVRDVNHDGGCWRQGAQQLNIYAQTHRHGMVMFDAAFEGAPPAAHVTRCSDPAFGQFTALLRPRFPAR